MQNSTVIHLLPKATFTPSIEQNLGLPRTRPPLTSAINTLLAIRSVVSVYLTGGVLECDIAHPRSVAVVCMLCKINFPWI